MIQDTGIANLAGTLKAAIAITQKKMGINGREKTVKEFDRNIVVNSYIEEIGKI